MDMKIISVNITEFGGLSDFSLEFSDGLNIIEGKNESGKSTALLFVMYMLYGLPKSSRRSTPGAFDKERSISRRTGRAVGSMEVECDGVRYRIERSNIRRGKQSEVTVTDLATGERVFIGEEPGAAMLGVSRETFESCLWCAQSRSFVISSEGVRDTLSNLSLTADESVNGDKVLKTLREEKKRYKHEKGNGGLIYEAMTRVDAARARVHQIDDAMVRTAALCDEAERVEAEKRSAEDRLSKADLARSAQANLAIIERFDKLGALKNEIEDIRKSRAALARRYTISVAKPDRETLYTLKNIRSALARRKSELESARSCITESSNVDMSGVELANKISERESEEGFISRIKATLANAAKHRLGAISFLAAGALFAVGGIFAISALGAALALFGVAAVAFCAAVMLLLRSSREISEIERELSDVGTDRYSFEKSIRDAFAQLRVYSEMQRINTSVRERITAAEQQYSEAEREAAEFFERFGLEYSDECAEVLARQIAEYISESEQIEQELSIKEAMAKREEQLLSGYDEAAIRAALPKEAFCGDAQAEYEAASAESKRKEERLSELKVQIATQGFDADARADAVAVLEAAKAERDAYKDRFDILSMAYDAVDRAYDNMRRNFAPKIRESAGEFLSQISEEKYKKVMLSENMEVSVEDIGEEVSVGTLSSGTADAVYMALRMSLVQNIFDGAVPMFMDESLSALDNDRAQSVLRMIDKFVGGGSQCILFTCHSREKELCERIGVRYNFIKL